MIRLSGRITFEPSTKFAPQNMRKGSQKGSKLKINEKDQKWYTQNISFRNMKQTRKREQANYGDILEITRNIESTILEVLPGTKVMVSRSILPGFTTAMCQDRKLTSERRSEFSSFYILHIQKSEI